MNTKKTSTSYFGIGLISIGGLFILRDMEYVGFHFVDMWPIFPSIIAILIWINLFLNPKKYELIMPASIFTVYSLMFWTVLYDNRIYFSDLWPLFMMGPALGFWLLLLSPYSEKNSIIPAAILTSITLLFMVDIHYRVNSQIMIGFIFVIIGLLIMMNRKNGSNSKEIISE